MKLFLINLILFTSLFLTSFSQSEVTTIQALPQRDKANLDIEVIKIKTDKITGMIYENEKKIIFDFKDLKKSAEKQRILKDNRDYEIFILEDLNSAGTYIKNKKNLKLGNIFEQGIKLRNGEKIKLKNITYGLVDVDREKVLEVSYQLKPETFYLGVLNIKTGGIEKIYKTEFRQAFEQSGNLDGVTYSTDLSDYIIYDRDIERVPENGHLIFSLGTVTATNSSTNKKRFPAVGLGVRSEWEYSSDDNATVTGNFPDVSLKLIGEIKYPIKPYFTLENKGDESTLLKKIIPSGIAGELREKSITLAVYGPGNSGKADFLTARINIAIPKAVLVAMRSYAYTQPGDTVEIPYFGIPNISIIPSSKKNGNSLYIPGKQGNTELPFKVIDYPEIKFYKNEPPFVVESAEELDFGTVLKGDNTRTAQSKIDITNNSGKVLTLIPSTTTVNLTNGDSTSTVTAGNFEVTSPTRTSGTKNSTEEKIYFLKGKLINTNNALEGEHRGTIYLNVTLSDQ